MATTVISNSCIAGLMGAIAAERSNTSAAAATYAAPANVAAAIAAEFITVNAASGAAMADADNAQIGPLVQSVAFGVMLGRYGTSTTATDYALIAGVIYGLAKAAVSKLS